MLTRPAAKKMSEKTKQDLGLSYTKHKPVEGYTEKRTLQISHLRRRLKLPDMWCLPDASGSQVENKVLVYAAASIASIVLHVDDWEWSYLHDDNQFEIYFCFGLYAKHITSKEEFKNLLPMLNKMVHPSDVLKCMRELGVERDKVAIVNCFVREQIKYIYEGRDPVIHPFCYAGHVKVEDVLKMTTKKIRVSLYNLNDEKISILTTCKQCKLEELDVRSEEDVRRILNIPLSLIKSLQSLEVLLDYTRHSWWEQLKGPFITLLSQLPHLKKMSIRYVLVNDLPDSLCKKLVSLEFLDKYALDGYTNKDFRNLRILKVDVVRTLTDSLFHFLLTCPSLRELTIEEGASPIRFMPASFFKNMQLMNLDFSREKVNLQSCLNSAESLRTLYLREVDLTEMDFDTVHLPNLENIKLSRCSLRSHESFMRFIERCEKLNSVFFNGVDFDENVLDAQFKIKSGISKISRKKLDSVTVQGNCFDAIMPIISSCYIKSLVGIGSRYCFYYRYMAAMSSAPDIIHLELKNIIFNDDQDVSSHTPVGDFNNLQSVKISDTKFITHGMFFECIKLFKLTTTIELEGVEYVDSQYSSADYVANLPTFKVKNLVFNRGRYLEETIIDILLHAPHLESVKFINCEIIANMNENDASEKYRLAKHDPAFLSKLQELVVDRTVIKKIKFFLMLAKLHTIVFSGWKDDRVDLYCFVSQKTHKIIINDCDSINFMSFIGYSADSISLINYKKINFPPVEYVLKFFKNLKYAELSPIGESTDSLNRDRVAFEEALPGVHIYMPENFGNSEPALTSQHSQSPIQSVIKKNVEPPVNTLITSKPAKISIDSDTRIKENLPSFKAQQFFRDPSGLVDPTRYILDNVVDKAKIVDGKLVIANEVETENGWEAVNVPQLSQDQTIEELFDEKLKTSHDFYIGQFPVLANGKEFTKLPALSLSKVMQCFKCSADVEFAYNSRIKRYGVRLKNNAPQQEIFVESLYHDPLRFKNTLAFNKADGLHQTAYALLEAYFAYHNLTEEFPVDFFKSLQFFTGPNGDIHLGLKPTQLPKKTIYEKLPKNIVKSMLESLQRYCKLFGSESIGNLHGISLLNAQLQTPNGACRHRAAFFKSFCDALDIACSHIGCTGHEFVGVQDGDGRAKLLDLGGYPANIDLVPVVKPSEPTLANVELVPMVKPPEPTLTAIETKEVVASSVTKKQLSRKNLFHQSKKFALPFTDDYSALSESLETHLKMLPPAQQNVLFTFSDDEQILKFDLALLNSQKAQNKKVFYLSSLKAITSQKVVVDDTLKLSEEKQDSDLVTFLKTAQPGDALVVDWSGFTKDDIGYNTMIDTQLRYIDAVTIPEGVTVICQWRRDEEQKLGTDFTSRFRLMSDLPADMDWHLEDEPRITATLLSEQEDHNLYHLKQWESLLIGTPDDQGSIQKGFLVEAIEAGKSYYSIINPPESRDFALFYAKLKAGEPLDFFGKPIMLPKNFRIDIVEVPYNWEGDYSVSVLPDLGVNFDLTLNTVNDNQYYENYQFEPEFKVLNGWIHPGAQAVRILVENDFSLDKIAKLLAHAKKMHCQIHFVFYPDHVPEEMQAKLIPFPVESKSPASNKLEFICAADMDFVLHKMEKVDFTISLSPQDDKELFEMMTPAKDDPYEFDYVKGRVLEALYADPGKKVVLSIHKNHFSQPLRCYLETLFAKRPFITVNGQQQFLDDEKIKGKLILLTNDETCFPCVKPVVIEVSRAEINKLLYQEFPGDKKQLDEILDIKNDLSYIQLRSMLERKQRENVTTAELLSPFVTQQKNEKKPVLTGRIDRVKMVLTNLAHNPCLFIEVLGGLTY